jgi:hypothetical protein
MQDEIQLAHGNYENKKDEHIAIERDYRKLQD